MGNVASSCVAIPTEDVDADVHVPPADQDLRLRSRMRSFRRELSKHASRGRREGGGAKVESDGGGGGGGGAGRVLVQRLRSFGKERSKRQSCAVGATGGGEGAPVLVQKVAPSTRPSRSSRQPTPERVVLSLEYAQMLAAGPDDDRGKGRSSVASGDEDLLERIVEEGRDQGAAAGWVSGAEADEEREDTSRAGWEDGRSEDEDSSYAGDNDDDFLRELLDRQSSRVAAFKAICDDCTITEDRLIHHASAMTFSSSDSESVRDADPHPTVEDIRHVRVPSETGPSKLVHTHSQRHAREKLRKMASRLELLTADEEEDDHVHQEEEEEEEDQDEGEVGRRPRPPSQADVAKLPQSLVLSLRHEIANRADEVRPSANR